MCIRAIQIKEITLCAVIVCLHRSPSECCRQC
uniref:Uncharacterized protein n=1 Tax=Anguilla anguilla TaxID=7936 RepID=A0A0E9UH81_ANGAN